MKINEWMYPYIQRLYATDHIDLEDMRIFSDHVNDLIFDLVVKSAEATWEWHWQEMSLIRRLKWRWENKRLRKYGIRDFRRLSRKAGFLPFI